MRRSNVLFTTIFLILAGCSPKEPPTGPGSSVPALIEYLPLKTGNSWTYSTSTFDAAIPSDTSSPAPVVLSIFQTNVLIGGQPNAFIVRSDDERGNVSYLAFTINGNTLWHYLGTGSTFEVNESDIVWAPGGVGGAVVGVNQTQKYYVTERSGSSMKFSIVRPPDSAVALAAVASQDSLQIKGISAGETVITLQKIGGTSADTMAVLIGVSSNVRSSVTSPLPSWIPLWQLTTSTTDKTVFSLDTTNSFRCISDSTECRDELHYLLTNRYVGEETVPALATSLHCDRFEMKVTVTETVTTADKLQTKVLFSGLSTFYTVDTWLAKGIGFVKGSVNGNSRSLFASMGGSQDPAGVLNGYYISPRVTYALMPASGTSYSQFFHVDDTPLSASTVYNKFILTRKNF